MKLEKCGAKPNVGETMLYKLLYFVDFNYYELFESSLTGEAYRRIKKTKLIRNSTAEFLIFTG